MREPLRSTLLTDGSSDRALLPLLRWVLARHAQPVFDLVWADLRPLRPSHKLASRLRWALEYYPCELLFVHRDAEGEGREQRAAQIRSVLREWPTQPAVCVVPVRMQEAWLLFDEQALRVAAGNPRGRMDLGLPRMQAVEGLPAPKQRLHDLLRRASGLPGRRLRRFDAGRAVHRLAESIKDFSALRALLAFQSFEAELRSVLLDNGWRATA